MHPHLESLCSLLRAVAEDEILSRFRHVASRAKADGSLITEADLAVQRRVIAALRELTPETPVLGEEMSTEQQRRLLSDADGGVWCLDPLDGTTNFASGFPYFSISLALLKSGEAQLGLVYDPTRGECFSAERGAGAWLDGEALRQASDLDVLGGCVALVDLKRLTARDLARMGADAPFRSQRNLGSVALDWCWIAAGRGQLYLHGGQKLWDYAAGSLIASEAGAAARLMRRDGTLPPAGISLEPRLAVAASNGGLLARWLAWLGLPR
jgi:myo-inositol-1(or 4)-monophosphatase